LLKKVLNRHCEERFLRRGNLEVIDMLKLRLLRFARKDGKKTFSAAC